jgi:hypothetical protein
MNEDTLIAKIKELEVQLAILKAQVKRLSGASPPKSFADLRGILKGKVESSEEDIDAVKYHFKWEDTEER